MQIEWTELFILVLILRFVLIAYKKEEEMKKRMQFSFNIFKIFTADTRNGCAQQLLLKKLKSLYLLLTEILTLR